MYVSRFGKNRIYSPYMTIGLANSLLYIWLWPTLYLRYIHSACRLLVCRLATVSVNHTMHSDNLSWIATLICMLDQLVTLYA